MCDKTVSRVTHSPSQCHQYQWSFLLDYLRQINKMVLLSLLFKVIYSLLSRKHRWFHFYSPEEQFLLCQALADKVNFDLLVTARAIIT